MDMTEKITTGLLHVLAGHWAVCADNLGLERKWAFEDYELDTRLKAVNKWYKLNFGVNNLFTDVEKLKRFATMEDNRVDLVMGSPPCIGISTGNPDSDSDHAANHAITRWASLVDLFEPNAFIMEMVHNFRTSKKYADIRKKYEDTLNKKYYWTAPVWNLSNGFGSPCDRKRVFYIGYHHKYNYTPTMPNATEPIVNVLDVFNGKYYYDTALDNPTEKEAVARKMTKKFNPEWKGPYSSLVKDPDFFTCLPDQPSRTFTAVGGAYFKHPDNHRLITKAEAKRLMGFPDDYHIKCGFSTTIRSCAWGVPIMSLDVIVGQVVDELQMLMRTQ